MGRAQRGHVMAGTSTPAMDILRRLNPITASSSAAVETASGRQGVMP